MRFLGLVWLCLVVCATQTTAQDQPFRYNSYGAPGLIDMPGAFSAPDAELAFSSSHFRDQTRNTATFQLSPRLSASFRYAALENVLGQGDVVYDRILDRSFALHFRFADQTDWRPALAVGVNDFLGTGIYGGEYVVATKAVAPGLAVTAGLGWGRLAGVGGFDNPLGPSFADRPDRDFAEGGTITQNSFFKGDAAVFGGVHWQPNNAFGLTMEYSSDGLPYEDAGAFERDSQVNVALTYAPMSNLRLSAHYLYGTEFGAQLTYALNPSNPPFGSGLDQGPPPVRQSDRALPLDRALAAVGLRLVRSEIAGPVMRVVVINDTYRASAQAIGRTARVLAGHAPPQVRTFQISLAANGLAGPAVTVDRDQLQRQEYAVDGSEALLAGTRFAAPVPQGRGNGAHVDWQISPYLTPSIFDPDDPLRADIGLALHGAWAPRPGFILAGTVRQKVAGNLDRATRRSDSVLPRVRSDFALYDREGDLDLINLTATWYAQPTAQVSTRASVGLLEEGFGGLVAEMLWRPPDSAFAYGVEIGQVRQRGYDSDFSFLDYEVTTGHASLYWDMGSGYQAQVDLGRYLAGDWGGTLTFARRFRNGWSVGAFATLTDVPFSDFGEGSFDKGVTVTVPIDWISGRPSRASFDQVIRPVTRDGGARLRLDGRLYDLTDGLSEDAIKDSWGRVWR